MHFEKYGKSCCLAKRADLERLLLKKLVLLVAYANIVQPDSTAPAV